MIQFGTLQNGDTLTANEWNAPIEFLNLTGNALGPVVADAQGNISSETVIPQGGTAAVSLAVVAEQAATQASFTVFSAFYIEWLATLPTAPNLGGPETLWNNGGAAVFS